MKDIKYCKQGTARRITFTRRKRSTSSRIRYYDAESRRHSYVYESKGRKEMPIIMLSAKTQDMDKILGLTTGADDYVTKPFNPLELIARIKSQLRRYMKMNGFSIQNEDELEIGEMKINISTHKVIVEGEEVKLTPREFSILELLARNPGMVFSAEQIYEKVWNERSFQSDNTVMVHIRKVREKIEENPRKPRYIKQYGEWGIRLKKIFNPFTYVRKFRELIGKLVKSVKRSVRIQLITAFTACALLGILSAKAAAPFLRMRIERRRSIIGLVWNKLTNKHKVWQIVQFMKIN